MKHEKIFEREDGSKAKLEVSIWLNSYKKTCDYPVQLFYWKKGARAWTHIDFDFRYLRLPPEQQKEQELKEILKYVSPQELLSVKMELWGLLKPSF